MTQDEKMAEVAYLFDVEVAELTPERDLTSLPWDSMTKLSLMAWASETLGVKLTGDAVRSFRSVQDILNVMR